MIPHKLSSSFIPILSISAHLPNYMTIPFTSYTMKNVAHLGGYLLSTTQHCCIWLPMILLVPVFVACHQGSKWALTVFGFHRCSSRVLVQIISEVCPSEATH